MSESTETQQQTSVINPTDPYNLRQVIIDSPEQFARGIEAAGDIKADGLFDSIVISGMGGSAMPGYLFQTTLDTHIPIFIHCNYGLPAQTTKNPLIFASSFSGNTEETIDVYRNARMEMLGIIGFANGGKLRDKCSDDQVPCIDYKIEDATFQPRHALPLAFSSMATVAQNSRLVSSDTVRNLENTASFLNEFGGVKIEAEGKKIAQELKGKIPIIYSSYSLRYAAMINKIKINEDAKLPAYWNFYPELNHNEFNGYLNGKPEQFVIISYEDADAHPRNVQRMLITNNILTEMGYKVISIEVKGTNTLEKTFYVLNWGSWIAYYLALEIGQDPTPVEMVERLKKKLEEA